MKIYAIFLGVLGITVSILGILDFLIGSMNLSNDINITLVGLVLIWVIPLIVLNILKKSISEYHSIAILIGGFIVLVISYLANEHVENTVRFFAIQLVGCALVWFTISKKKELGLKK